MVKNWTIFILACFTFILTLICLEDFVIEKDNSNLKMMIDWFIVTCFFIVGALLGEKND